MITAEIIKDSINKNNLSRITTFVLEYPRFIHSEFMTHRLFSRNAASSRAIPAKRFMEMVKENPAIPVSWLAAHTGMQGKEHLSGVKAEKALELWLKARDSAVRIAKQMTKLGVSKQIVNRILEPWMYIKTIVTSTDFSNFFDLRNHPAAENNFQVLAKKMLEAYNSSVPEQLCNDWHLPFVTAHEKILYKNSILVKLSTARCARVSYLNHDKSNPIIGKDIELHDDLVGSTPKHASPAEHQAFAAEHTDFSTGGNFRGWVQYRKLIEWGDWDVTYIDTMRHFVV